VKPSTTVSSSLFLQVRTEPFRTLRMGEPLDISIKLPSIIVSPGSPLRLRSVTFLV
jgi:hypothetical protein